MFTHLKNHYSELNKSLVKKSYVNADIRDYDLLESIFSSDEFQVVIHFVSLKAVGESVKKPILYYENNLYGDPISLTLEESMPTGKPTNPYGMSKLMIENILTDVYKNTKSWRIVNLRYLNPVGAHWSGLIGEDPTGILIT